MEEKQFSQRRKRGKRAEGAFVGFVTLEERQSEWGEKRNLSAVLLID
jgi:hypothetical protein